MAKLAEINEGNPLKLLSVFLNQLGSSGLTLAPETLGSPSRTLKTHIPA